MSKDLNRLRLIFQKTDGQCHICHKKLSFNSHGRTGQRRAWHVEHSVPRAKSGTDHLNNLYAACIKCNIEKGTMSTRAARNRNGKTIAPHSKKKKEVIRSNNRAGGAIVGSIAGAFLGPVGIAAGAIFGAIIGDSFSE